MDRESAVDPSSAASSAADAAVVTDARRAAPGSASNIASRLERLPLSRWQVKIRLLIGTGTFFDAFDALAIAQVLPVLTPLWGLTGTQIAALISIGYLGQLIGALLISSVAERFGRTRAMALAIGVFSLFSVLCALSTGFWMLLLMRFLQGIGLGGQVPIGAVYINEITKAKGRGRFVLLFELIFSVGVVLCAVVGRFVVPAFGWQGMFLVGALPVLLIVPILRLVPESPRWLASRGREQEADVQMVRIERAVVRTGKTLGEPEPLGIGIREARGRLRELLGRDYRRRTLTVWVIWFATYIVYYGIGTWLPSLYRGHFGLPLETSLNFALIGNLGAFLGAAICAFTIDLLGRRRIFILSLAGSAVMMGVLAVLGAQEPWQVLVFGSLAYLAAGAASIGLYLYTPEIYPTRIRAVGVGAATSWLRIASMIGPVMVGSLVTSGLGLVCGIFAVIAAVAAVVVAKWATETKDRVLEEISH